MSRSEMMENKLSTVLCALLLLLLTVNLGSTEDGNHQAAAPQSAPGAEVSTGAPAAVSAPAPGLEPTIRPAPAPNGSDTNISSSGNSSLSSITKEEEITPKAPEPEGKNDTNISSPTVSAVPENSSNQTDDLPLLSTRQTLPPESQTTTSQTTTASTSQTTTTSPPHTAHDMPADTTTTNSPNYPESPPPDSISTSNQTAEPKTHQPTSAPTPEPPKPETTITITATTTTATSTQSKSKSSTSSSQESPKTVTPTSPHTSQSHAPRGQAKSTTAPSSSSTAKPHADTPSQLNVGGDTMMVHESPTLDPLLAGLVTAFIITAVVITLLLFLKLRRRDNRPEFRRLQDLPMDDMMEDTPLSMYSY